MPQNNTDLVNQLDSADLLDAVNVILRNREKIFNTVDLVWDNWDDVMDAVEYVLNHRGQIAEFLTKIPEFLGKTGDFIHAAGISSIQASAFLTGDGARKDSVSVRDLADAAAAALDRCQGELQSVAGVLEQLGKQFDDVRIPTLKPEYSKVMGFDVVTGFEFGESNFIDRAAEQLKQGAERLEEVGKDFQHVAQQMRKMGGVLTEAGGDLRNVGGHLQESGAVLSSLAQLTKADPGKNTPKAIKPRIKDIEYAAKIAGGNKSESTVRPTASEAKLKPLRPLRDK